MRGVSEKRMSIKAKILKLLIPAGLGFLPTWALPLVLSTQSQQQTHHSKKLS